MEHGKRIFTHYFKLCFPYGYTWGSDNQVEIEGAVEDIIQTAIREATEPLETRIEQLEKDVCTIGSNPVLE